MATFQFRMNLGGMKRRREGLPWVRLLLWCLAGYWPLSLGWYGLKNDAVMYFLPYRYHISEAIGKGVFPFWNPYLYSGIPLHADVQSGAWNPVVWFFSFFTRYSLTTLQVETLFYIFLAGVGMYKLTGIFAGLDRRTRMIAAVSYMFCGFITDSGQFIVWVASAAFVPFVLHYFLKLLEEPGFRPAAKLALALYLLLTAGYPSFMIFMAYLLAVIFMVKALRVLRSKNMQARFKKHFFGFTALALVLFLGLAAPALVSYLDFSPYYARGTGASLEKALSNPFNPFCSISFVTPLAVTRPHQWIQTDPTARNIYPGLFILLFFILSFFKKLSGLRWFILGVSIFAFLFSWGGATPLRGFCYRFVPLMDLFRHPSNMRLFAIMGIILVATPVLNDYLTSFSFRYNQLRIVLFSLAGGIVAWMLVSLLFFRNIPGHAASQADGGLKAMLYSFDFNASVWFQGLVQLGFLGAFYYLWRRNTAWLKQKVVLFFGLNSIIIAGMSLPFTFVSQVAPKVVNDFIKKQPDGYPLPSIQGPLRAATDSSKPEITGISSFYSKQLTIEDEVITPTLPENYERFLLQERPGRAITAKAPVYLADTAVFYRDTAGFVPGGQSFVLFALSRPTAAALELKPVTDSAGRIQLKEFSPNGFKLSVQAAQTSYLVVAQQYNTNWHVLVDGKAGLVIPANIAFFCTPLTRGRHEVEFFYSPKAVNYCILLSLITMGLIIGGFIYLRKKKNAKLYAI